MKEEFATVSTKIPISLKTELRHYCEKLGITPSEFLHQLIEHNVSSTITLNYAGINSILYEKNSDAFEWKVKDDEGGEKVLAAQLSPEFLENLKLEVTEALSLRADYLQKNHKNSIPIPFNIKKIKMVKHHARK